MLCFSIVSLYCSCHARIIPVASSNHLLSDEMTFHRRRPFLTALAHLVAHTPAHVRLIVTAAAAVDIHSLLAPSMSVTEIIDLAPPLLPLPMLPPRAFASASAPRAPSSTSDSTAATSSQSASASSDRGGHDNGSIRADNSNTGLPGFCAWHLHAIFSRIENHQLVVPPHSVFELAANIVKQASFGAFSTARQIIAQFAASREVLLLRSHLVLPISSPHSSTLSTASISASTTPVSSNSSSLSAAAHQPHLSSSLPSSQLSTHTGDGFAAFGAALCDAISGFRPRWRDLAARCFAKHARLFAQRIRCECESQHGQSPTVRVYVL